MKYVLLILLTPLLLVFNFIGAISAFAVVGVRNGFFYTVELINKTQENKND